jgi:hypothetical protein
VASDIIHLRYAGTCSQCGAVLSAKTQARWDRDTRTIVCLLCEPEAVTEPLEDLPENFTPLRPVFPKPIAGQAGASAAYEYQRRHAKREEVLDQRFGRLSGVVKFLVDDPQSTKAWAKGADGEKELAEALNRRVGDRGVLLHDRKIPRSCANIDHLAIAASGVWVIDAKKYKGSLTRIDKGGWFRTDMRVYVGGRDRTKLTQGLHKQAAVVRTALGRDDVPIHEVLCFIGAEWDFFLKPFQIDGVWIIYGRKLAELIAEHGPLSNDEVLRVANVIAVALPPKVQ